MELWTGALSRWKCHWHDLKSAGLFPWISSWTPFKPQHNIPNPNPLANQLWCIIIVVVVVVIIIITILLLWDIFTPETTDGLSLEFEWHQVSRNLLSIRVDLNSAVVWIISTRILISYFFSPFISPLVTVPSAPISLVSLSCFIVFSVLLQGPGTYLSFWLHSILHCGLSGRQSPQISKLVLLTISRSGCLAEIR